MKKEIYICWHEDNSGEIDSYELISVPEDVNDIANPDNVLKRTLFSAPSLEPAAFLLPC